MISDGFGDELTNEEVVHNFRLWTYKVANSFHQTGLVDADDLAQEGLIAMWRALEKKGGKAHVSATYLTQTGRFAMIKIVEGKPLTGGDTTPGPRYRPSTVGVDWSDVAAHGEDYGFERLLTADDLLSAVDWAYHHGEIVECLNSLSPQDRAYVYSRFWQGKTDTEIAAERGVSNKMLGGRWAKTIRPVLVKALAHLA